MLDKIKRPLRLDDPDFIAVLKVKWHRFIMIGAPVVAAAYLITTLDVRGFWWAAGFAAVMALLLAWSFHYKDLPKRER